ncbi:MAG: hypothetical protein KAH21_06825, partial [Spirochaetaceae bacterium]|nr:hypothetical protein [Spirochaetaceae bacterium]
MSQNSQSEYYNDASISKSISRPDGMAKATGSALYVADLNIDGTDAGLSPDMLTGRFYRSSHPRGKITRFSLPETPEGYFIVTAADIPEGGKNEIPMAAARDLPCFAKDEVRYIGQIAAVVAGPDPVIVD